MNSGRSLDNVCDAVAHILVVMAVGMHYGGLCALLSLVAAIVHPGACRLSADSDIGKAGGGSPTNELMRHILFALVVTQHFGIAPEPFLAAAFVLNAVSMQVPYPLRLLDSEPHDLGHSDRGGECRAGGRLVVPCHGPRNRGVFHGDIPVLAGRWRLFVGKGRSGIAEEPAFSAAAEAASERACPIGLFGFLAGVHRGDIRCCY